MVEILRWAAGAKGIATLDGKVLFVPGAIPGEHWQIDVVEDRGGFCNALQSHLVKPSPQRATPPCKDFGVCGGCDMQHISLEGQSEAKRAIVEDQFRRIGKLSLLSWEMVTGASAGYRRRARLVSNGRCWGFREAVSHRVVVPQDCLVLSAGIAGLLGTAQHSANNGGELSCYETSDGVMLHSRDGGQQACERVAGKSLQLDAGVFFQSNPDLMPALIEWVMQQAGEGHEAVDMFSGVGVFAAFLADKFAKVHAVERDEGCLVHARRNLPSRVNAVSEAAETWWLRQDIQPDVMVVDPPRTGLPPELLRSLCKRRSPRLVYVSCDPATQARDCRVLVENGWKLAAARGFDFYPHTHHMEFVVTLLG